jgi:hypothetical protein
MRMGASFVLAYIPESYLFDVEEGGKVAVKARGQTVAGYIEKVLPVTEALPPEFQLPNKGVGNGPMPSSHAPPQRLPLRAS